MDENRNLVKINNDEKLMICDVNVEEDEEGDDGDTMYTTCPEITLRLDKDRKRKITIISETENNNEKKSKRRSDSQHLRRQAMINNALSRSRSRTKTKSRSRSRSRSKPRCRSQSRNRSRQKSTKPKNETRSRSSSATSFKSTASSMSTASDQSSTHRERSRTRRVGVSSTRKEEIPPTPKVPPIRLPTNLCWKNLCRSSAKKSANPVDVVLFPSPLFIMTEQQVTGVSESKSVQFVTKILLTTKRLTIDDRKELYNEMVEAEYIGTSRSSTNLNEEESIEDFECRIYYSKKGVYIHTVQIVKKIGENKTSKTNEEKTYSKICKTRIIGNKGKYIDGFLTINCSETIKAKNQLYTRLEVFKIGLKTEKAEGSYQLKSNNSTFDPTKTIKFNEKILFDHENIGLTIDHEASADMSSHWNHEAGSFGEQQCNYREVGFIFNNSDAIKSSLSLPSSKQSAAPAPAPAPAPAAAAAAPPPPPTPILSKSMMEKMEKNETTQIENSTMNSSTFYKTMPEPSATSTPKSESSPVSIKTTCAKSAITPTKCPSSKVAATTPSIRQTMRHQLSTLSPNEIDMDHSLKQKPVSRNLSSKLEAANNNTNTNSNKKKKDAAVCSMSTTSSQSFQPAEVVKNQNSSKSEKLTEVSARSRSLTPKRNASQVESDKSSNSAKEMLAKGKLRIKETKITREIREETGKPAEVKEKKEETVKEHVVPYGVRRKKRTRSRSQGKSTSSSTTTAKSPGDDVSIKNFNTSIIANEKEKSIVNVSSTTPIVVPSTVAAPTKEASAEMKHYHEAVTVNTLIDGKQCELILNLDLLAKKKPDILIKSVKFAGKTLWEKSSEWSLSSDKTTSSTKTIAVQQSDIMSNEKK